MNMGMTPPRRILIDRTHMITRRCTQRKFLLRPSKKTDQAFVYCFAVAAKRYDVDVYWLSVQANHYHAGVRDKHGNYPEFLRYFHSLVARCLNAYRGRWENLWSTEPSGALELGDAEAIFDKMTYSLCNPVKDHLVDRVLNWPGFISYRYQLADKPVVVKRPKWFFNKSGSMPEEVELRFDRPPEFAHLTHEQWADKICAAVTEEEEAAARARQAEGKRVLGRKAILRQSPFSCPKSFAVRRGLRPRVASKNKWRRIELLQANKDFQRRYREAYRQRRAGDQAVVFPLGTYKLRVHGLVCCESAPARE